MEDQEEWPRPRAIGPVVVESEEEDEEREERLSRASELASGPKKDPPPIPPFLRGFELGGPSCPTADAEGKSEEEGAFELAAEAGGKKDNCDEGTREMRSVFFCIGDGGAEEREEVEVEGERVGGGGG